MHVVHSFGGTEDQIDGLTDANGVLTVVDEERSLMNTQSPLTLELEDGRQMEFLATNYDPVFDSQIPHLTLLGAVCVLSGGVRVSTRGDA